ncbi:hypothetical protein [Streptomyces sp. SJL17-1]|uniref:hypothetical protein n=1 Tax=Streptomyces sp. SJL17-1 TaxID=2967223 RepID=UPI00296678B2|nr:hypothetical protein [Streptomyces sp. SJL17-1]
MDEQRMEGVTEPMAAQYVPAAAQGNGSHDSPHAIGDTVQCRRALQAVHHARHPSVPRGRPRDEAFRGDTGILHL